MFIPTINTGGREAPFSTPVGPEKWDTYFPSMKASRETNKQLFATCFVQLALGYEKIGKLDFKKLTF